MQKVVYGAAMAAFIGLFAQSVEARQVSVWGYKFDVDEPRAPPPGYSAAPDFKAEVEHRERYERRPDEQRDIERR